MRVHGSGAGDDAADEHHDRRGGDERIQPLALPSGRRESLEAGREHERERQTDEGHRTRADLPARLREPQRLHGRVREHARARARARASPTADGVARRARRTAGTRRRAPPRRSRRHARAAGSRRRPGTRRGAARCRRPRGSSLSRATRCPRAAPGRRPSGWRTPPSHAAMATTRSAGTHPPPGNGSRGLGRSSSVATVHVDEHGGEDVRRHVMGHDDGERGDSAASR